MNTPLVDAYLANVNTPERQALQRIREIVKSELPEAEEVITYAMPGFKYKKKYLLAYAPFKHHMSLFPGGEVLSGLGDELKEFAQAKGTLQFTLEKPLPESTVRAIVQICKQNIESKLAKK
jgi:uncharacterized protein YdhG (YjbR/CyaY superfamily)